MTLLLRLVTGHLLTSAIRFATETITPWWLHIIHMVLLVVVVVLYIREKYRRPP